MRVLPYLGYGTRERVRLCGRVLRDPPLPPAGDRASRWRNLVAFYRRMESDEVPGARVRGALGASTAEAVTDREGYFSLALEGLALRPGWHGVRLFLEGQQGRTAGRVLVPSPRAKFGLVSDIDDTVVFSNVGNKLKMVLALALSNARTRKPFAGVAAFYRALHAGTNPVFYVSKSPWNLYTPLVEYLAHQRLPAGPLFLRDFGLRMRRNHKTLALEQILATYPRLQFVLIGDSGEEDPEIYSGIVHRFPQRIRVIYIRCVDERRIAHIERLIEDVAKTGCQLVLVHDTAQAAVHAAGEGLIQPSDVRAVASDKRSDESRPAKPAVSSGALK